MAKKKDEEVKARVMRKTIGGLAGIVAASDAVTVTKGSGWTHVFTAGQHVFYNIQAFDLSGYSLDDKTTYIQAAVFQDMGQLPVGVPVANMQRATLCSITPLTQADLTIFDGVNQWQVPGTLASNHTPQEIVRGRVNYYLTLSTFAGLQQVQSKDFGIGDSTAADKLWVCDAIVIPNTEGANFALPDQNFVIPIVVAEEPDLEYIMRLSRSVQTYEPV